MIRILALLLSLVIVSGLAAQTSKPNIVFILTDDHAYQAISAYGSQLAQTPGIDRIAREGALFRNSFVTNSICGPSRACFLTGKYSHINGYKVNEKTFNINQPVFSEQLQQAGYQTAWIGKMHLDSIPHGFDYVRVLYSQGHYYYPVFIDKQYQPEKQSGYVTDIITRFSTDWLDQRDSSKPFFLVVGQKATHREWLPALEDLGAYDDKEFPLPPNFFDNYINRAAAADQDMTIDKTMRLAEDLKVHVNYDKANDYNRMDSAQRRIFKAYYDRISQAFDDAHLTGEALLKWKYQRYLKDYLSTAKSLDRNVGRLLDYIDSHGLRNNTIVVYASDQGFYMGEHGWFDKRFMYEESLRTPFMMRYPGHIKPGSQVDGMVLNIDWGPTLLDMAGIKPAAAMQGQSFAPLVTGHAKDIRDALYYHYYEFPQPHHVHPHFGLRTKRYKLIRFYGQLNSWELYDLQADPQEMKNLIQDKKYAKLVKSLRAQLATLAARYQDQEVVNLLAAEK